MKNFFSFVLLMVAFVSFGFSPPNFILSKAYCKNEQNILEKNLFANYIFTKTLFYKHLYFKENSSVSKFYKQTDQNFLNNSILKKQKNSNTFVLGEFNYEPKFYKWNSNSYI